MSGASVVVDADNGIDFLFAQSTDKVVGTLLHFGVGTLNGIQLDTAAVASGFHAGNTATAQADAIVVSTNHHNLVSLLGSALQAVALGSISHTTGQHDDLVVGIFLGLALFLVFKSEDRAANQGLAKLVSEVRSSVAGLDQNLFRGLVQPFSNGKNLFPFASFLGTGIAGHVHRSSCNGP